MKSLDDLYQNAQENGIPVFGIPFQNVNSMIIDTGDSSAAIGISTSSMYSLIEEREALAHELGHYYTGTYYDSTYCTRNIGKMEYQANVWMVNKLIPIENIRSAIADGCREYWEFAEYCNCTQDLVQLAVKVYTQKGLL